MRTMIKYSFLKKVLFISILLLLLAATCWAANPFITTIYTADPSAHVWADGRLYVYPSHDMDPALGCDLMDRYHIYSTADLVNWVDEGEILRADQVSWGRPDGGFMWAPDCAYKNGTYYYYFPHPSGAGSLWNNTWKIGVCTSTKPNKDFTCIGYIPGLESGIDPCVFIDDDGQAYLYYGNGCLGGKLNADMISINGSMQQMVGLQNFHEATWVFKRNNIYYLTYADGTNPNNYMRYATSSNPLGPWTYKGIFLTEDSRSSDTTHGSVFEFKGQWYLLYHNKAISNTGAGNLRSICIDRLNFNTDGTIQQVSITTSGPPEVGPTASPYPVLAQYEAENATIGNGATIVNDGAASGGKSVQNLQNTNSYVQFNNVNSGNGGRTTIHLYYAASAYAKLRLTINGIDQSFMNTIASGGGSNYSGHAYLTVILNSGTTNTIRLTGGNGSVNLDYMTVTSFNDPIGTPTVSPTPTPSPSPTPTVPPSLIKYEAENGTLANGATVGNDAAASGGKCVQNLHIANASCQINNVDGGTGGAKYLYIFYATIDSVPSLTLTVNGTSLGAITCPSTGGWSNFNGYVVKAITLNAGTSNTIKLTGGSGGVNLDYVGYSSSNNTPTPTPTATPTPTPISGALDRTGWVASGSGSGFSNAFDGNAGTRWSTDAMQVNGQYFQVDLQSAKTFNQIQLDTTGSPNDYPRGYQVFVSSDATNWGSMIASGSGTSAITNITFTAQTNRYLKIVQTGSAAGNYWSIHEFNLFNSGATPTPTPTSTPTPTPVPGGATLDTCDALTGWSSHNTLSLDTTNKQQGTGCLSETGAIEGQFWKSFGTAVNTGVTESAGYLEFEYYISDATKLSTNCQIEISSSGAADVNEYSWSMPTGLVNGWNHFKLKLSNAGKTGTPNLSAINWFRIYNFVTASVTAKIDNIRFTP